MFLIRSRIIEFLLQRKRFSDNPSDDFAFGVSRLVNDGVYLGNSFFLSSSQKVYHHIYSILIIRKLSLLSVNVQFNYHGENISYISTKRTMIALKSKVV